MMETVSRKRISEVINFGKDADSPMENKSSAANEKEISSLGKTMVQCLLKGDKVFSLNLVNGTGWSTFISGQWNRKNCKFVIGDVIMKKDWSESKMVLQIKWENRNIEKLRQKSNSADIAYGDRLFILDRQCVSQGSRVFLVGHPELEGIVTAKRYLATGITTSANWPDLVFEDIDVNKLRQETHGSGYKDRKILYRGWLGITSGYRTRIYLQSQSEDASFFSVIVDGHISQRFNIGDEINLGFKILRSAEFVGGETGNMNWLYNFFKFYNTNATIVDYEIDELIVCWIGKAATPNDPPSQYDLPNAPDELIPFDELCHVQYLVGESQNHMTSKSLWIHECSGCSMPKDKWVQKWLKTLDWDRWEYPGVTNNGIISDTLKNKYLTLEIMYTRSVIDVCWNNGSISTVNTGDVIPVQVGSVWSDMMKFRISSIVKDRLEIGSKDKYGIIIGLTEGNCATVKWITPMENLTACNVNKSPRMNVSTTSLHSLAEKSEYDFISKTNQCPLVSCGKDGKLGIVLGFNSDNHKTRVKMVDRSIEHYWPHEMVHYKCDILLCSMDQRWTFWYDHLLPPSGIIQIHPDPTFNEDTSSDTKNLAVNVELSPKKKFESIQKVPLDNIFVREEMLFRTRETNFHQSLEQEIAELEKSLPEGMWVESYDERYDIFSAIVTGPKNSFFEDFIFIFDIFLMEDFPKSEPHINFRSMELTLLPGHLCKTGAVFLPEETRLAEEDFSCSCILNLLLEMRDFLGIPLELIHEKNTLQPIGVLPEAPEELYKFVALGILEYTLALLQNPPKNWRSVIINHFAEALPRIIERFKKGGIEIKRPIATVSNEKGDGPNSEEYESLMTVSWNEEFFKTVNARIEQLEKIHASMLV